MLKDKLVQFKDKITNNPSFTLKEQMGYAGGIFGNSMGQDSVNTFSDKFFRNFMGISNRQMTWLGNIFTIQSLITTPIAGHVMDTPVTPGKRTPTKSVLRLTPIPFAIASMLLFVVPFSNGIYNFVWTLLVKFIYNIADSFYDTSLNAMSLRMTTNAKDRKNFYTMSTFASALGSMLPGWIIPIAVGSTGDPNRQKMMYFWVALVFCILGVVSMFAPYFTLEEKIHVEKRPEKEKVVWDKKTISTLVHSRSFMVIQIANFFEQIRQLSFKLLPYIYEDTFGDYKMKAAIDAISGTLSYVGLAAVPFLNNVVSARTIMSGGFAFSGLFYSLMLLCGLGFSTQKIRRRRWLIGFLIGISGMPNSAIIAAKKVMVGDATDYMEWYSTKKYGIPIRSEGLISSTQGVLGTIYNFIRTNLYNILFEIIGYQTGGKDANGKALKVVQSNKTLRGIYLMFTLCSVFGNFLASASYLFDNFTGKRKEQITAELMEFRAEREKRRNEFLNEETEHAE